MAAAAAFDTRRHDTAVHPSIAYYDFVTIIATKHNLVYGGEKKSRKGGMHTRARAESWKYAGIGYISAPEREAEQPEKKKEKKERHLNPRRVYTRATADT